MSCDEVRRRIPDHVVGALDAEERQALTAHVKGCPGCKRELDEARVTAMLLRESRAPRPPQDLAANIKAAALAHLYSRPKPMAERALGSPAFLATCASLLSAAALCLVAFAHLGAVQPTPDVAEPAVVVSSRGPNHTHLVVRPTAAAHLKPKVVARRLPEEAAARPALAGRRPANNGGTMLAQPRAPQKRPTNMAAAQPPAEKPRTTSLAQEATSRAPTGSWNTVRVTARTAQPHAAITPAPQRISMPSLLNKPAASLVGVRGSEKPVVHELGPGEPGSLETQPIAAPETSRSTEKIESPE